MRTRICSSLGLAALLVFAVMGGHAAAQPDAPAPAPVMVKPTLAPSAAELAKLDECRALASSSDRLRGQVKNDLRPEIQKDDAKMTMTNKRHVVMAYAALWILAVGFLVLLFFRQQRLVGEIARLESDLRKLASEGGGEGEGD